MNFLSVDYQVKGNYDEVSHYAANTQLVEWVVYCILFVFIEAHILVVLKAITCVIKNP